MKGKMQKHMSHGSPASIGASKGPGEMDGAGQVDILGPGPGRAASRVRMGGGEVPTSDAPSGSAPKGMKVYREE